MGYEALVLADSISPAGHRLTTVQVTFPRLVLAEANTHRAFSRNSASSRAIPVSKQVRRIMAKPFVPDEFGANQPGMQAGEPLSGEKHEAARRIWLDARNAAVLRALQLMTSKSYVNHMISLATTMMPDDEVAALENAALAICDAIEQKDPQLLGRDDFLGVHKGLANRLLEPFMWHTVIITATEYSNFFALRTHPDAQREIRLPAKLMQDVMHQSTPQLLGYDEWHLPLIQSEEMKWARTHPEVAAQASCARCARVSYLTHDTGRLDVEKDVSLYQRLASSGHMSPLEHAARPMTSEELATNEWSGNFRGWHQHRKDIPFEHDFSLIREG